MTDVFAMVRSINKNLEVVVHDPTRNQIKTRVFMNLEDNEIRLESGRFRSFARLTKYDNEISIMVRNIDSSQTASEKIDWISKFTNHKWSLTVIPEKVPPKSKYVEFFYGADYNLDFIFSFENKIDAGYFALRWR